MDILFILCTIAIGYFIYLMAKEVISFIRLLNTDHFTESDESHFND